MHTSIMDNSLDVVSVSVVAAETIGYRTHPEITRNRCLVCCNDDVVPLAHSNADRGCGIWDDRHKIRRNDRKSVIVD